MKAAPGVVMTLPGFDVPVRHVLVLSVDDDGDEVTVLVLSGQVFGNGPGQVKVLRMLHSFLLPL